MKFFTAIAACVASALLAGCESDSLSENIHTVLGPREAPQTRVFQAEQRATYEAARAAALEMGYRIIRGGPAEGKLDALSEIAQGETRGSSRQVSMKVRMVPAAEAGTSVEVSLTEIIEENTESQPGTATETPLRDTPLYEVFFRDLQRALVEKPN
jgi:hypothetical protein